jgi:four helix bundle protein
MSHNYKDLVAWQKAKDYTIYVYELTRDFPDREKFGLTAQLQRAAVSIVSNIAEGQGRLTKGEFRQFLGHARGSLLEVLTQLEIAAGLTYISETEFAEAEIRGRKLLRIITALSNSIKS